MSAPGFENVGLNIVNWAARMLPVVLSLILTAGPGRADVPADWRVLSAEDAALYARVFALQDEGQFRAADRLLAGIDDDLLHGHVLFQRYMHPTAYRARYPELHHWMKAYRDHPGAHRVYKLGLQRRVAGWKPLPRPTVSLFRGAAVARSGVAVPRPRTAEGRQLRRLVLSRVANGWPTGAEEALRVRRAGTLLGAVGFDDLRYRVARSHFVNGNVQQAFDLAAPAADRSRHRTPNADWIAGLAAWALGDRAAALGHFEALAASSVAAPNMVAAGGFWGARAALATGRVASVGPLLAKAAPHHHTFHGQLARATLGGAAELQAAPLALDDDRAAYWRADAGVRRAVGLLQAGRDRLAELELRAVLGRTEASWRPEVAALVQLLGAPALELQLGHALKPEAAGRDALLYPVPAYDPDGGYRVDRALVYAFIRQESAFRERATSPVGARGLMQLMPRTASYISNNAAFRQRRGRNQLYDPQINLSLGQKYLAYLMQHDHVGKDLIHLTAAYNGGPGNLSRWLKRDWVGDDPLLFIETIPRRETRNFVKQVVTNFWLYRQRLGQDTPSLNALVRGAIPAYVPLDRTDPPQDRLAAAGDAR